jgi:pyruvate,water dikinase
MEDICKLGIDFVSFGTNDLTQYTLAIDRNNVLVQKHYDELHPAVLAEIARVIKICKKYHVQTSICGQAGSKPKMASFLVRQGIDSISANPDAVNQIRQTVAVTEKRLLLDAERRNLRPQ